MAGPGSHAVPVFGIAVAGSAVHMRSKWGLQDADFTAHLEQQ